MTFILLMLVAGKFTKFDKTKKQLLLYLNYI